MNKSIIRVVTGRILILIGAMMLLPFLVSLYYREGQALARSYLLPAVFTMLFGAAISVKRAGSRHFYVKEGLVVCSLVWVLMSFFGAFPLYLSKDFPTFIDAFFEIASGFTTTGSTVSTNVEALHHSTLLWRAFTHFIGGMGVLVFALALLPKADQTNVHIMKAEVPGPAFGKLTSSLSSTARILYLIYVGMTVILTLVLLALGLPLFDAVCHAMATAGTGGFSIKNASVKAYHSPAVEWTIALGMLMFGVNFNLYYFILLGKVKDMLKDEELRWYIIIILAATALISLSLLGQYVQKGDMVRDAFFTVTSIISTTGFSTADFTHWPLFAQIMLLLLMLCGAMAGSTAGGLKVSRVIMYAKQTQAEMRRQREPGRIVPIMFQHKAVSPQVLSGLFGYLTMYVTVFLVAVLLLSLDSLHFAEAFSAVAATFNNIGPAFDRLGPSGSFAFLHPLSKLLLSFVMIAGRLEIWPIIILLRRTTWKRT